MNQLVAARPCREVETQSAAAAGGVHLPQGPSAAADLVATAGPVWIVHGNTGRRVPPANTRVLTGLRPAASATDCPDSRHGAVVQNHAAFVAAVRDFLHH